jgi:phosphoglycerate dehydrogenase-like enzyme
MYFAKNFKQLEINKQEHKWDRFPVGELRGKTMGIIGCGGK